MNIVQQNVLSEEAFEEVNNILQDEAEPTESEILMFKINELQKIITSLTRTNEKLINRIEQLQDQIEEKGNTSSQTTTFNEQYSVMQCDFNDIEEMIKEYKKELGEYQKKMNSQLQDKFNFIETLRKENQMIRQENDQLKFKIDEIESQNQMLEQTKDNLLSEIQDLESNLRRSKAQSPRYGNKYIDTSDIRSRYDSQVSNDFSIGVQNELQKLIEKLIKQLQHERFHKKKLTQQIKKLQKDILDQQKQIITKNNKIYALEITALKKYKNVNNNGNTTLTSKVVNQGAKSITPGYDARKISKQRESVTPRMKNFSLMQLMNECLVLSARQKLIIALKIIDLYIKKLQRKDYTSEILESIMICNFNSLNPQLCSVKINKEVDREEENKEAETESQAMWNLVFILDSLFNQTDSRQNDFGVVGQEEALLQGITFLIENKDESNMSYILDLKRLAEQALSQRTR